MIKTVTAVLLAFGLATSVASSHAAATLESFKFTSGGDEQRFKDLIAEIRCLVCQNQSLLDSDAELAHDLRVEVYGMMQAGQADNEIIDFLVARYGDFVLYKPPVKPATYFLWFGPFVLLVIALTLLIFALRRQRRSMAEKPISATDRQQLDRILGNSGTHTDSDS
ncbi:MAG: cytochrome c-type biogenesis protein CcmH [Gammaproteobacteria bacterium]|nr:MAG: cytochrome c-type biogenesis protein CcmH [Gammaproteobacteria bacterium]